MAATKKQKKAKLERLDRAARVLYEYTANDDDPNYSSLGMFLKSHYTAVTQQILDAYNQ